MEPASGTRLYLAWKRGQRVPVRTYVVYGIEHNGARRQLRRTASAREAKTLRDAGNSPFARIAVFGADGELSVGALDELARKEANLG